MKTYYKFWYRLDRTKLYLIWYDGEGDGVVVNEVGQVPAFGKKSSLRTYADKIGLKVEKGKTLLTNLDVTKRWLKKPRKKTVNCKHFLNAWNLFQDIASSAGDTKYDSDRSSSDKIYSKLFYGNNLPAITPPGKSYEPLWTKDEVKIMHEMLAYGLEMFRNRVIIIE